MKLITVEALYGVAGVFLFVVAMRIVKDARHPRRWGSALFWMLLAVTFAGGKQLPSEWVGGLVVVMIALAATGQVARGSRTESSREERLREAERLGNRLFRPALLIPIIAVLGSLFLGRVHVGEIGLVDSTQAPLIALGLAAVIALISAVRVTGARYTASANEGGRLLETAGWALILPQMLAALGGIFAKAGVGEVVADLVARVLPTQFPVVAVVAYCGGMALFTMIMGNAFAAFAVITGGIGLPLIVTHHHGNPAIMASLGMLSGYCGTLLTPMAANFNLVPAMLLELDDRHAVIKAQVPLALTILAANVGLMWACVYRF